MSTWIEPGDVKILLWEKLNTSKKFASYLIEKAGLPAGEIGESHAELLRFSSCADGERDLFFFAEIDEAHYALLLEFNFGSALTDLHLCRRKVAALRGAKKNFFQKVFFVLFVPDCMFPAAVNTGKYPYLVTYSGVCRWLAAVAPENQLFYREFFTRVRECRSETMLFLN